MIPGSEVVIDMSNLDTARNSLLTIFNLIADHLGKETSFREDDLRIVDS